MAEAIESAKLICQGGLDGSQNYLNISEVAPGSANALVNFEASLFGGYRRIDGFQPLNPTDNGVVGLGDNVGPILCVAIFKDEIYAARRDSGSNTYDWFRQNSGTGWIKLTTGLTFSSLAVERIRYVTFNFDGTEKIMFVDGTNYPTIFDGTTWSFAGGDQIIARPKYINLFKNTIFVSGDINDPHLVAYSSPSDEADWTAASGAGQIIAGFSVTQICPFRDALYVFGQKNIKKIGISGTNFIIDDVAHDIGCIAPDSVVEINGDLMFIASDGIRTVSATEKIGDVNLASVSKKIQSILVNLINIHAMQQVTAVVIPNKSQVRFFFSDPGDPENTTNGIIGSLRESSDGLMWEWGELKGIRASSTTQGYIQTKQFILHGDYNGKVYRQEMGNSFDGNPIKATFQTTYLDFGESQRRKTIRNVNIFVRPEGNLTLNMNVSNDYGATFTVNPAGYTTVSEGVVAKYGTSVTYGMPGLTYGSKTVPVMVSNVQGSFFSTQLTFTTSEIAPSYSIQGLVFEFSVDGRN